ncbi:MAG: hypothetical protein D3920_13670, partial [Candidatus Electrothrix sp. AW2]|nr:hypothetical protein [Candidatus Electrothrix gigas]
MEEAPVKERTPSSDRFVPYIFPLSAMTNERLHAYAEKIISFLENPTAQGMQPADLAYTFQVGRKIMDERLAVVFSSLEGLKTRLAEYIQGDQKVSGLYQGTVGRDITQSDMPTAEYDDPYHIAQIWATGTEIDWQRLYADQTPQRITAPTYPFAEEHCWLERPVPAHEQQFFPDLPPEQPLKIEEEASAESVAVSNSPLLLDRIKTMLQQQAAKFLKTAATDIDMEIELEDCGFDSLSLTEFTNQLNQLYSFGLDPALFFEYPSIDRFAAYLLEEHTQFFAEQFAVNTNIIGINTTSATTNSRHSASIRQTASSASLVNADEPVAVIGMSGSFPMAADPDVFWQNLVQRKNCISEVPDDRWDWKAVYGDPLLDPEKTAIKWGGFIDGIADFDPDFFGISPKEAELMDPQQRLLLLHAWKALENAAVAPAKLAAHSAGVFIAAGPSGYLDAAPFEADSPFWVTSSTPWAIPNRISHIMNLTGPSEYYDTACSSSLVALHRAVQALRTGECQQALVGAVNLILSPKKFKNIEFLGALSPQGKTKSFQSDADGYVCGEGAGAVLLKPLHQAQADGDRILALVRGVGVAHGGRGMSLTAPNSAGMKEAMLRACKSSGIDPQTVAYVEAHGSGTPLADGIELQALKAVYGSTNRDIPCYISTLKPCIGHGETVSGMAALIKVIQAVQHKTIPGLPEFTQPIDALAAVPQLQIAAENIAWQPQHDTNGQPVPRRAGINCYGFGGVNAHLLVEEYPVEQPTENSATATGQQLAIFSATTPKQLKELVRRMEAFFASYQEELELSDITYTLQTGREAMKYRLALSVEKSEEMLAGLRSFLTGSPAEVLLYTDDTSSELGSLFSGEMGELVVRQFIEQQQLDKLAAFWTKGGKVDWEQLYTDFRPQRISLPGHPFTLQPYWIEKIGQNTVALSDILHPEAPVSCPANGSEFDIIAGFFTQILGVDHVTEDSNFFEMGGQSIAGVALCRQLSRRYNIRFELNELYQAPTPALLAAAVQKSEQ